MKEIDRDEREENPCALQRGICMISLRYQPHINNFKLI